MDADGTKAARERNPGRRRGGVRQAYIEGAQGYHLLQKRLVQECFNGTIRGKNSPPLY